MFPVQEPFTAIRLDVGDGHELNVAEYGNPQGVPVVYLHGGPGAGFSPGWQKYFNPDFFRIILFDQRGCGGSTPTASTENNSIEKLIGDLEKIRVHLGIETWVVGGGSWGSTLALLYADRYPERTEHLILRGIFFATKKCAAHIAEETGARPVLPDYFELYRDHISPDIRARDGLIAAYDQLMQSDDPTIRTEAARRFMLWDTSIAFHRAADAKAALADIEANPAAEIPITALFMHYSLHEFDEGFRDRILNSAALETISMDIIQGADDRICPLANPFALARAYPHARLRICQEAGHSGGEVQIVEAHIRASEELRLKMSGT